MLFRATVLLLLGQSAAYSLLSATYVHPSVRSTDVRMASISRREAAAALAVGSFVLTPLAASAEGYQQLSMMTTEGEMQFELWDDVAPKHVASFLKLTKEGFYDGCSFHRIIPGFVIQGGDPNTKIGYGPDGTLNTQTKADKLQSRKWGTGGPGYTVPAEFNERPHEFGVLSMARGSDVDSAGSQFFVCLSRERCASLDKKYTVFGKLIKGEDVLKRIAAAETVPGDIPIRRQGIQQMDKI